MQTVELTCDLKCVIYQLGLGQATIFFRLMSLLIETFFFILAYNSVMLKPLDALFGSLKGPPVPLCVRATQPQRPAAEYLSLH